MNVPTYVGVKGDKTRFEFIMFNFFSFSIANGEFGHSCCVTKFQISLIELQASVPDYLFCKQILILVLFTHVTMCYNDKRSIQMLFFHVKKVILNTIGHTNVIFCSSDIQ